MYKNKICGNCSNFYCGKCVVKEMNVDALQVSCEADFQYFNKYSYNVVKEMI